LPKMVGSRQILATSEIAENRTNLIVGLGFRGLRGPVDQPGIQRMRAGRRSPAWQVVFDPECGKALALLRRAAGSNPARSTTFRAWREVRVGPRGPGKFAVAGFRETVFKKAVSRDDFSKWAAFSETCFKRPDFQEVTPRRRFRKTRFQESDLDGLFPAPSADD